jgi:hypothetical protein
MSEVPLGTTAQTYTEEREAATWRANAHLASNRPWREPPVLTLLTNSRLKTPETSLPLQRWS